MKRTVALTATALTLVFGLAACGGDGSDTEAASSEQQSETRGARPGDRAGSGKVASVEGSTAQVQGSSGQTAVTWSDSTTFTREVSGSFEDLTKGSCVVVMGEGSGDTVTASSVRISQPVDGECAAGPGGDRPEGGERASDKSSEKSSDESNSESSDRPEGAPEGQEPPSEPQGDRPEGGPGGGMTAGEVTEVSDSGFTVEASEPGSDEKSTVKVTVEDDTTYTSMEKADADDVKVGVCIRTHGETDSTGAVKATSIQISSATDGECGSRGPDRREGDASDGDSGKKEDQKEDQKAEGSE